MVKCAFAGCSHNARYQVEVWLWPPTHLLPQFMRDDDNCLKALMGFGVCAECRPKVKAEHILTPEAMERINSAMDDAGRVKPDVVGAELRFIEMDDNGAFTVPVRPGEIVHTG